MISVKVSGKTVFLALATIAVFLLLSIKNSGDFGNPAPHTLESACSDDATPLCDEARYSENLYWGLAEYPLFKLINAASEEVLLAVPDMGSTEKHLFVEAVTAASRRSVSINILSGWPERPDTSWIYRISLLPGISIRFWDISALSDSQNGLYRAFFGISDKSMAFIGVPDSLKWDEACPDYMTPPCCITSNNPDIISGLRAIFEADWSQANAREPQPAYRPTRQMISGPDALHWFEWPDITDSLREALDNAQQQVILSTGEIGWNSASDMYGTVSSGDFITLQSPGMSAELKEALCNAAQRGVTIRVVQKTLPVFALIDQKDILWGLPDFQISSLKDDRLVATWFTNEDMAGNLIKWVESQKHVDVLDCAP